MEHSSSLKGHLVFMEWIKNHSIGVIYGVLHVLFWIFKCVASCQFARELTADFLKFFGGHKSFSWGH